MEMAMDFYLAQQQRRFTRIQHRLQQQHPQLRLARQQTALFQLQRRLGEAMDQRMRVANRQQDRLLQRLNAQQPQGRILRAQQQLQQWHYRLQQGMEKQLNHNRQRFGTLAAQLEGVSPLATLARGFSVTTDTQGQVVKKTQQLSKGDLLRTRLDDGWVESQVTALEPQKSRSRKARS
jgi:exodeoxyribonuclease VII large subunit